MSPCFGKLEQSWYDRSHNEEMARCRARTKNGTGPLCTRHVKQDGQRCFQHRGLPEAPPRISKSRSARVQRAAQTSRPSGRPPSGRRKTSNRGTGARVESYLARIATAHKREASRERRRQERDRERVTKAAEYCADVVTDGWTQTAINRSTDYVTDAVWQRLFGSRHRKRCRVLAEFAKRILEAKAAMHDAVGWAAGGIIAEIFGVNGIEREFIKELVSRIPLPPDPKLVAAGRGIQLTGILLCLANDRPMVRCQCFIDLALTETKTRVKKILAAGVDDWTGLAQLAPTD